VTTYVVLLRGINVGRHRRIAMSDLRALLDGLGYSDVRTHLQSGNVVLASGKSSDQVRRSIEKRIAEELGVDVEIFVRTRDELAAVIALDPLGDVCRAEPCARPRGGRGRSG
jgi:uncharacterized protein (DUF1697 family)